MSEEFLYIYFKITQNSSSFVCTYEEAMDYIGQALLEEEKVSVEPIWMSKENFDNLSEFQGF